MTVSREMKKAFFAAAALAAAGVPTVVAIVMHFGCCALPFHQMAHKLMPLCHAAMNAMAGDGPRILAITRRLKRPPLHRTNGVPTMKNYPFLAALALIASCVSVPRDVQIPGIDTHASVDLTHELTADQAVAFAMTNNPRVQVALAGLGIARADLIEASTIANPLLETELRFPARPYRPFEVRVAQSLVDLLRLSRRRTIGRIAFDAAQVLHHRHRGRAAAGVGVVGHQYGQRAGRNRARHRVRRRQSRRLGAALPQDPSRDESDGTRPAELDRHRSGVDATAPQ